MHKSKLIERSSVIFK